MGSADSLQKTLMLGKTDGGEGGEGGDRGWDGWMASPTQWRWVWANSRRWWRTEKAGVGLERVVHDSATEQEEPGIQHLLEADWPGKQGVPIIQQPPGMPPYPSFRETYMSLSELETQQCGGDTHLGGLLGGLTQHCQGQATPLLTKPSSPWPSQWPPVPIAPTAKTPVRQGQRTQYYS